MIGSTLDIDLIHQIFEEIRKVARGECSIEVEPSSKDDARASLAQENQYDD